LPQTGQRLVWPGALMRELMVSELGTELMERM
jgi:hypothetical protein